jgi:dodecin
MPKHVYKVVELMGSSKVSVEDAIRTAVVRASATLRHLRWFEVVQVRGHLADGKADRFQVTLKAGFTLEDGRGQSGPPVHPTEAHKRARAVHRTDTSATAPRPPGCPPGGIARRTPIAWARWCESLPLLQSPFLQTVPAEFAPP